MNAIAIAPPDNRLLGVLSGSDRALLEPHWEDVALEAAQRELDVVKLVREGYTNQQIAESLFVSVRTVETHRQSIKRKLCLGGPAQLIQYAVRHAANFD